MKDLVKTLTQDSGEVEMYTPYFITLAAQRTMGGIDLDPASCQEANHIVHAKKFYTKEDNGFILPWSGRVWLNHPFGKGWTACTDKCIKSTCVKKGHMYEDIPGNEEWINKLLNEHTFGDVTESCNICFASTSEKWFQPLMYYPQCYLTPRTNYIKPGGKKTKQVLKGSVVTYIGPYIEAFYEHFNQHGTVTVPFKPQRRKK